MIETMAARAQGAGFGSFEPSRRSTAWHILAC